MEKGIKVSIIVPTYNRAEIIIECLDSIIAQSYQNIELIVVDDGSTDKTKFIVESYIKSYEGEKILKYIKQSNQGAPSARNKGLENATGEYIVFFDSDDLMMPERIKLQIERIIETNSNCCICGYKSIDKLEEWLPPLEVAEYLNLYAKNRIVGSTQVWMFFKDHVKNVGGYDVSLACHQDGDLAFRILWYNEIKLCSVKEPLSVFVNRESIDRITSKWNTDIGFGAKKKVMLKIIQSICAIKSDYIFTYSRLFFRTYFFFFKGCKNRSIIQTMTKEYDDLVSVYSFRKREILYFIKYTHITYCYSKYLIWKVIKNTNKKKYCKC